MSMIIKMHKWMVFVSGCYVTVVPMGFCYSLGALFVEFMTVFQASRAEASLIQFVGVAVSFSTGIVAGFGNLLVLFVLIFGRPNFIRMHTILMYITAISDLVVASIAYPLTAVSGYSKRWYFDEITCVVTGFLVYFATMCTINSLCSLAILRYIVVCRPEYECYIRGKFIVLWVSCIFAYALLWTGAPLLGWSSYGHEPFQTSCTLNWYGDTTSDVTYNSLCIVFCYCVPVFIFIYCYYHVLKTSLFRTRPIQWHSERTDMEVIIEKMSRNSKLRASRHMTWICLAMVASFVVIWTPYTIVTFWNLVSEPVPSSAQVLPTMFAKLSCATNPIIYCAFCDRFREALQRARPCKRKVFPALSQGHVGQIDVTVTMLEENRRREHKKTQNEHEMVHNETVGSKQTRIINVQQIKGNNDLYEAHATTSAVDNVTQT
ncbi:rhodopsin, G0-coupled-like [Mercenaria mercenaria]|uniref:rhodopsin, G0-coupled-like n=1 Tax=Mercenaria mercenaria TaxID=6596 RepID=UPI00234EDF5E|nr:rhodopsin, G0-coupled-like [Mercenaria mercenaria]